MAGYPNQVGLNLLDESLNADNTPQGDALAHEGMYALGDSHTHTHAEGSTAGQMLAMQLALAAVQNAHDVAPHGADIQQVRSSCSCTDANCANGRQNMIHGMRHVPADSGSPMERFSDLGYDQSSYWS
jgi:hypothetical protein